MRKIFLFTVLMSFIYHAVVFELILGKFSPLPSYLLWIIVAIISWIIGTYMGSFSKILFIIISSFIIAGIISYFLMSYYIRESVVNLVQMITLKMISVSLLTIFVLSSICAFLGYMFRSR
ncbi:MAG TPA: hypothetical protein VIL29_05075 [Pseudothermotoga sp.]